MKYDYLIIGAGLSGIIAAEQLTRKGGKTVLLVDKRDHIAGNCFDYQESNGVLVHKYGPHYFRTNSKHILNYLSEFTEWIPREYRVLSKIGDMTYNFPINLNTFEQIIGRNSSEAEMIATLDEWRTPIDEPKNSEEVILDQVGEKLYKMFFEGYTLKQWKKHPKELATSVCGRIPIRTNRDDRYLNEKHQMMPRDGYTKMCERILDSCGPNLEVRLNTDYRECKENVEHDHLIYTGMIDAYYDYQHGRLPYRSLRFEINNFDQEFIQPEMQLNYPEPSVPYTRTVEIKHATGQKINSTTVVTEYPEDYQQGMEPYYPIPNKDTEKLYLQYKESAEKEINTTFLGRLGTYKYYNMDQCIGLTLKACEKLINSPSIPKKTADEHE